MYRKKLMRACLTGLMVVTVATANVAPVFAADTAAQTTDSDAVEEFGTVIIQTESGESVASVKVAPGTYNYSDFTSSIPATYTGYVFADNGTFTIDARGVALLTIVESTDAEFTQSVVLNYYDELNNKQAAEVTVQTTAKEGEAVDWSVITANLPAGYIIDQKDSAYLVTGGYVYIAVAPNSDENVGDDSVAEATQEVRLRYFDETNTEVRNMPVVVSAEEDGQPKTTVDKGLVTRFMPNGFHFVGSDFAIVNGEVIISVSSEESSTPEVDSRLVIDYYDEATGKQVAAVPVDDISAVEGAEVDWSVITAHVPEGYVINQKGTPYEVVGGQVAVSVSPMEETQEITIKYYDRTSREVVAEVPTFVSKVSGINMAILTRYMPEGYAFVWSDFVINNGVVEVAVNKDVEIREAVLHITFETPSGEVVGTETVSAEGADGEDAVFKLGTDFNLPEGYKLSNDDAHKDQVTEITIPFGSTGGHTMIVEKGDLSSIVKVQFVDADTNEVVAGGDYFVDGDGDGIFHTRELTEWVPEGYKLEEVGDFQVSMYTETPLQLSVTKIKEEIPWTPLEPSTPADKNDTNKDDTNKEDSKKEDTKKEDKKKNSPKTGDETSAAAAALPAGVSLAAILAVLVKKFK